MVKQQIHRFAQVTNRFDAILDVKVSWIVNVDLRATDRKTLRLQYQVELLSVANDD